MRTQIKKEEEIKGKVLEDVRFYPWSGGAIVLLFENNEATIFEISEYDDSLHLDIMYDNIFERWDYEGLYRTDLITDKEMLEEKKKHDEDARKRMYQWYLSLKEEFEGLDK